MAGSKPGGPDKFLIGIVAAIVVLVIVALAVVILQPDPAFRNDGSPEAAVHNYLLALRQEDYEQAYSYLSPRLAGYPENVAVFIKDINNNQYNFRHGQEVTLTVDTAAVVGDSARVTVLEVITSNDGIFASGRPERPFEMQVQRVGDDWKLSNGDYYWAMTWNR